MPETFLRAWPYDLIVVGSALNNIAYPLSSLWRLGGKAIAYWGHGRDSSIEHLAGLKGLADGFFAYTRSVRDFLVRHGIAPASDGAGRGFDVSGHLADAPAGFQ